MRSTKRHLLILIAVAAVATLAACHSSRHVPPTPSRTYTVTAFTATVEGIEASGQLRVAEDSALWVSATKLIELGRGLATRDSVWLSAPALGQRFAGTYADLSRKVGKKITFAMLQEIATADDAEERLARLATELGVNARVKITSRRQVDSLTFPFRKSQ